jgi:hypothetical protein
LPRPEISKGKLRKTLRRIERARADAEAAAENARLSDWEAEYLGSVEERLAAYGSAFRDPTLGRPGEPLSRRQKRKLDEIDAKLKGEDSPRPASRRSEGPRQMPGRPPGQGLTRRTPLRSRKPERARD